MSIIPQARENVNTDKSLLKWQQKKTSAIKMAEKMAAVPRLRARAARMQHCGDMVFFRWCPKCGHSHGVAGGMCRDRLCPLCEWRLSMTRYSQMLAVFDVLHDRFISGNMFASMLTLTVRNVPVSRLRQTLIKFTEAWRAVLRRACMKPIVGWARNIEITRNEKTGEYHPHVHILLLWEKQPNVNIDEIAVGIVNEWDKQMHLEYRSIWNHKIAYTKTAAVDYINDPRTAAQCAAAEAAMYTLSSNTILNIPTNEIEAFAAAVAGVRMTGYGGCIKSARKLLDLRDDEPAAEAEADLNKCPKCGEQMQAAVLEWVGGTYRPSESPFEKGARK